MAVWPSLNVVKSCAREIGKVEFLGMTRSVSPPIVSRPRESGITSNNSRSFSLRLPAKTFAWMAAPNATTLSGSRLVSGSWPKKSATAWRTCGMRVAPPTMTTPLISATDSPASRKALRVGESVLAIRCWVSSVSVSLFKVMSTRSPDFSRLVIRASAWSVSHSLASRDLVRSWRVSSALMGDSLAFSSIQQNIRRSKSSPPSAESPLVAKTSNTPLLNLRMEISNVPPPRS